MCGASDACATAIHEWKGRTSKATSAVRGYKLAIDTLCKGRSDARILAAFTARVSCESLELGIESLCILGVLQLEVISVVPASRRESGNRWNGRTIVRRCIVVGVITAVVVVVVVIVVSTVVVSVPVVPVPIPVVSAVVSVVPITGTASVDDDRNCKL